MLPQFYFPIKNIRRATSFVEILRVCRKGQSRIQLPGFHRASPFPTQIHSVLIPKRCFLSTSHRSWLHSLLVTSDGTQLKTVLKSGAGSSLALTTKITGSQRGTWWLDPWDQQMANYHAFSLSLSHNTHTCTHIHICKHIYTHTHTNTCKHIYTHS